MKTNVFILTMVLGIFGGKAQNKARSYETSQGLVVHEWGTFTTLHRSDGAWLEGLHKEEEALPKFTYNLCDCYLTPDFISKGLWDSVKVSPAHVNVKMETPVLYFYNPFSEPVTFDVDVKFKNGSISQWYPTRKAGEIDGQKSTYPPLSLDFSNSRMGYIQWECQVSPHGTELAFTNKSDEETEQWKAQRATKSDFVSVGSQTEKFLFYRGIANFIPVIKAEFNTSGNVILTNYKSSPIPFALIYEQTKSGEQLVWWKGQLPGNKKHVCSYAGSQPIESFDSALTDFRDALVNAGLYEDEAAAMLATWKKSYFGTTGLKIFWIVPDTTVNELLPLKITPSSTIKRVFVGRMELMKPEFEQELLSLTTKDFNAKYGKDRFSLAYEQFRQAGRMSYLDQYNTNEEPETQSVPEPSVGTSDMLIYPNPSNERLIKLIVKGPRGTTSFTLTGNEGKTLLSGTFQSSEYDLDASNLAVGTYYLDALLPGEIRIIRRLVRN